MGKPLQPAVVEFLRLQECGFEQGYPKVCCSALSRDFQVLKHARPSSRKPTNMLSVDTPQKVTTHATRATTKISTTKKIVKPSDNLYSKADALNKAFMSDYFDYTSSFDLMLRIKRQNDNDDVIDIEIR